MLLTLPVMTLGLVFAAIFFQRASPLKISIDSKCLILPQG